VTHQPSLTTERLILRPFSLKDAQRVRQLAGEKEIAENTATMPHPYEEGMAEEWINSHEDLYCRGENVHYAVCLRTTAELIGAIGIVIKKDHDLGEIGYWIGVPYWNQGYCTEAAKAIIQYGFNDLQLNRIGAIHYTRNPASGRVLEKAGMKFEGIRPQAMKRWGVYVDVACYGILREDYITKAQVD
jgi:RimJ/RimL family protein N-acetyltransferase